MENVTRNPWYQAGQLETVALLLEDLTTVKTAQGLLRGIALDILPLPVPAPQAPEIPPAAVPVPAPLPPAPATPSVPPPLPPVKKLDREDIKEELALGEVKTVQEAVAMLLEMGFGHAQLAEIAGVRTVDVVWAANGTRIVGKIKSFFEPLLPGAEESEETEE